MVSAFCENRGEGELQRAEGPTRSSTVRIFSDWGIKLLLSVPGGEHGCQNSKKCYILRFFYLNSDPTYFQLLCVCVCVCMYVCVYVCMCAVSIRPVVIINKSIYEIPAFMHLLRRQLPACGVMLPAAFQGAPRSQPSEIMLSEWVNHLPQRVRAAPGCAWWCAGQCAR